MQGDDAFPPHPFWDFSLAIYRGAVPAVCLQLQERHGLDVNILLYALWRGTLSRQPIDSAAMPAFVEAVLAGWHHPVVRVLRHARHNTRSTPDGLDAALVKILHDRILQVELAAEHAEQLLIAELGARHFGPLQIARPDGNRQAAVLNLQAYFLAVDTPLDEPVLEAIDRLLEPVFGPQPQAEPL